MRGNAVVLNMGIIREACQRHRTDDIQCNRTTPSVIIAFIQQFYNFYFSLVDSNFKKEMISLFIHLFASADINSPTTGQDWLFLTIRKPAPIKSGTAAKKCSISPFIFNETRCGPAAAPAIDADLSFLCFAWTLGLLQLCFSVFVAANHNSWRSDISTW